MIRGTIGPAPERFVARLAARAAALASARAETALRARRGDGAHWRKAGLLWPDLSTGS